MSELLNADNYQDFTLDILKTSEGVTKLNSILRLLSQNVVGNTEDIRVFHGYGTPEAVVTAGIGSKYLRLDGSTGTTNYTKESGTGSTGWVAEYNFSNPIPIANGGTGSTTGGNYLVPSGGIIIWSGSSASIPSGWFLCNGANSTPDLRDKFIVGAGSTYAVNATGGATTGTPTINSYTLTTSDIPSHSHAAGTLAVTGTIPTFNNTQISTPHLSACGNVNAGTSTVPVTMAAMTGSTATAGTGGGHTHTASSMSILPPYYALCYIMKS